MFRNLKVLKFFVIFLILTSSSYSYGQNQKLSTKKLKEKAAEEFSTADYSSAYKSYSGLLRQYPKDGLFNYYCGLSLYFQNIDIPKAIDYLDYASGKAMVPADVFYYLGMAYRKSYMFKKSKSSFNKFSAAATRVEIKELSPSREADMSGNAMNLTLTYNPFEVLASSFISFADSSKINQVRGKGGILSTKPKDLIFREELENNLSSYLFLPKDIRKGDYVFLSSNGKSKKKGLELFRVKKLNGKNWGDPEPINDLNTDQDEIMPYFDPISKDLYFASKGYNSIGGFDVFKSHYDSDRDNWSKPINLGFPINSPQNEFIAMPGSDLGTILIVTDRHGMNGKYAVYKLQISEPKRSLSSASSTEIQKIGNLGRTASIPILVAMKEDVVIEKVNDLNEKPFRDPHSEISKPEDIPVKKVDKTDPFTSKLNSALGYQSIADSLTQLAKTNRLKAKDIPDPNERWAIQKNIIEWEKKAGEYQEKANQAFRTLNEKTTDNTSSAPDEIALKTVINDIKVYEYSEEVVKKELNPEQNKRAENLPNIQSEKFKTQDESGEIVETVNKSKKHINRFVILDSSPYNSNYPIPIDVILPDGSFYRIQLGAFGKSINYNAFGGISPITAEFIQGKNLTRYYAGKFSRHMDAEAALTKVKSHGYKDAYIVGWYKGEKMSHERVYEFEKRDNP